MPTEAIVSQSVLPGPVPWRAAFDDHGGLHAIFDANDVWVATVRDRGLCELLVRTANAPIASERTLELLDEARVLVHRAAELAGVSS